MTDQELLRAYADRRDIDSLGAFVARHQQSLISFATRLLGDGHAAQDVVQETFLSVAEHPRRTLAADDCRNWLLRVTRNIGMDHLRREVRGRRHANAFAARAAAHNHVAAEPAHAAALEEDERRARVRAEIAKLAPRHRELLLLRIQEEKSYREIAEITGLTATNVGFILHQAMTELTRRLKGSKGAAP